MDKNQKAQLEESVLRFRAIKELASEIAGGHKSEHCRAAARKVAERVEVLQAAMTGVYDRAEAWKLMQSVGEAAVNLETIARARSDNSLWGKALLLSGGVQLALLNYGTAYDLLEPSGGGK